MAMKHQQLLVLFKGVVGVFFTVDKHPRVLFADMTSD